VESAKIAGQTGVGGEVGLGDRPPPGGPEPTELEVFEMKVIQGAASIPAVSFRNFMDMGDAGFCRQCGHAMEMHQIEGREIPVCPSCGHVAWRNPLVATMVIVETPGGIVLGRRSIEPGYGLWCLPGGFVNDDEHPMAAAARECQEEIGARVEIRLLLDIYHIVRGDGTGMIGLAYAGQLGPGQTPIAGSEMLEVGLFAAANLPDLAFKSHHDAIRDWAARNS